MCLDEHEHPGIHPSYTTLAVVVTSFLLSITHSLQMRSSGFG